MPPYQSAVTPRRHSLEIASAWALFATIAAAAFVFIPSASVPFLATKTFILAAGALITLALYILARLSRGNIILPPLALVGALWLPVIAYVLSAAFSGVPFVNAFWGTLLEPDTLGSMLILAVLGTLSALVLRRPEQYRAFLRVGAWVFGVLVALQVLVVIVGQFSPSTIAPSFSIVGSLADLAAILGFGIIGALISFRELELTQQARRLLTAACVGALFLLALANASLVWVLLALVSLGLFVESIMRNKSHEIDADFEDIAVMDEDSLTTEGGNRSLILPLVVLAVSLFFILGGTLSGALANALHVNEISVRPSWQATFAVAGETFALSPVFGTGPGTFGADWLKYRDTSLNSTVFWNVDFSSGIGFIPTSFVTTGLVGIVAWVAFLALFIGLGLRMLILRAPQDAFTRYVAIVSFLASLYLFTLAVFTLPSGIVLALAFVFAGLFISTMRFGAQSGQRGVIFSRSPRLGFVIVFMLTILLLASVAAAYSLVGRYIATVQLTSAASALAAGDLDAAEQGAQSSISFAPSAAAYQLQANVTRARLNEIAASSTMPAAVAQKAFQESLSTGINAALTATSLAPADYQNWIALGSLYAQAVPLNVSGAYDSAKAAYTKAGELSPTNPQIPYILAQLNIAHKDIAAAQDDLKAAITLKQDYTAAIFLLSQLEVQTGNVKDALTSALAAAYFTPNNPSILFQVGILYAAQNDLDNAVAALSAAVAANPDFANARYFLSAVYAKQGNMTDALAQMQAIAAMSSDNAAAVSSQLAALEGQRNPFPANLLSVSSAPVQ